MDPAQRVLELSQANAQRAVPPLPLPHPQLQGPAPFLALEGPSKDVPFRGQRVSAQAEQRTAQLSFGQMSSQQVSQLNRGKGMKA